MFAGAGHAHGAVADLGDHGRQPVGHDFHHLPDVCHLVAPGDLETVPQVAVGHGLHAGAQTLHATQEAPEERGAEVTQQQQPAGRHGDVDGQFTVQPNHALAQRRTQAAIGLVRELPHAVEGCGADVEVGRGFALQRLGAEDLGRVVGKGQAFGQRVVDAGGTRLAGALQGRPAP